MSSMGQHHFYDLKVWTHLSNRGRVYANVFVCVQAAPEQSYESDQLLPVVIHRINIMHPAVFCVCLSILLLIHCSYRQVPMYYPPDSTGTLNAFFFTTPVPQPGSANWYLLTGEFSSF